MRNWQVRPFGRGASRSGVGVLCLAVLGGALGVGPGTRPGAARPVPGEAEQIDARRGVREKYAKDFADVTAAGRRRLAGMLLRDAGRAGGDAAVYVCLTEARDLAAGAGEVEMAIRAAGELARAFDLDADAARFAVLQACAKAKLTPADAATLARAAADSAEGRLAADDFDGAARAAQLAEESGRRAGDPRAQAELAQLAQFCRDVVRQAAAFRAAMATLEKDPDHAESNTAAAEFLVLAKQEWGRALVMLTKGTDKQMRSAAAAELGGARGADLIPAADAWSAWAEKRQGPGRLIGLKHARGLYERAAESADGGTLEKCIVRVAAIVNTLPADADLADTRGARAALGDARWSWWGAANFGPITLRDDAADLKNSQVVLDWRPTLDPQGDFAAPPTDDGPRAASDRDTGRLTYRLRQLCLDDKGEAAILEKEGKVTLRDPAKPIRLQGAPNKDIRRLNNNRPVPAGAHLVIYFDGVKVSERVYKLPTQRAWWLDESLVVRKDR